MGARRCGLRLLERHDRRFVERLPVHEQPASSPAELANRMKALGEVLDGLVEDAAAFDPPRDAANATGASSFPRPFRTLTGRRAAGIGYGELTGELWRDHMPDPTASLTDEEITTTWRSGRGGASAAWAAVDDTGDDADDSGDDGDESGENGACVVAVGPVTVCVDQFR